MLKEEANPLDIKKPWFPNGQFVSVFQPAPEGKQTTNKVVKYQP